MNTNHVDRELIKDWIVARGPIEAIRELMDAYGLDAKTAVRMGAELLDELAAEREAQK